MGVLCRILRWPVRDATIDFRAIFARKLVPLRTSLMRTSRADTDLEGTAAYLGVGVGEKRRMNPVRAVAGF